MNASSSARRPMPRTALPTRTGARIDSLTPLRRHASSSGSLISSPSRYLARTSSSASAAASSSWSRRRATSAWQLVRDRDLDLGLAVPLPGLAMDQVDVAGEGVGGADRQLERRDLVAERGSQRIEGAVGSAFSRSALLMKKQAAVPVVRPRPTAVSRPASTPPEASTTNRAPSHGGHGRDGLGHEVGVAGRIDHRHDRAVVVEGRHGQAQRLAPLLLLGLVVEGRRPVVDPAQAGDRARLGRGGSRPASSCPRRRGRPARRCADGPGQRSSSS